MSDQEDLDLGLDALCEEQSRLMEPPRHHETAKRPPTAGRKRGTACERCNRRRTRCDGWIIGVPCTACKKSNNHAQCALMQSKRRRGADGRYTIPADDELRVSPVNSNVAGLTPVRTSSPVSTDPEQHGDGAESFTGSCPTGRSDRSQLSEYESPEQEDAVDRRARRASNADRTRPQTTAQPSFVGESWYASYVMRGYKPGHTSLHRPIDDCNQTVQNVSRDKAGSPKRPATSRDRTDLSDLPSPNLTDRLIKAYFDRFHTFCPILVKKCFFSALADGSISGTLLRSVLFVASLHCDMETLHLMGYSMRLDASNDLFTKASASFDADRESDRTNMVLSSYLLHYWFGNPTTYRDAHWWLAAAIRSAQCMGYHRSTKNTQMPPEEKSRWKRMWWCLYVRDRQTSLSTGTPMVINDLDHDVEELVMEDLPDESPETAQYIISQMELNKTATRLYFLHCSPSRLALSRDASVRQLALEDVHSTLKNWYDSTQGLNFSNGDHHLSLTLKVCYYYYLINLHQRLQRQSPQPKENKLLVETAGRVFSLVEDSLLYWTPEHFPMIYVSALFSAMMALAADGSTSPPKSDQLRGTLRPGLLALKQFEPVYVLARWIRNFFMDILSRSEPPDDVPSQEVPGTLPGQEPITPQSVPHISAESNGTHLSTPLETGIDYSTPSLGVVEPSTFVFSDGAPGAADAELTRGTGGFWPTYMTHGVFSSSHSGDVMEFPQPDSLQYQAMYFLADLGIAGSESQNQRAL